MVSYIRSDLDFILEQIKIAENHAAGIAPLYGPGGLIPSYNLASGLRTVDGSFNNLLPGREYWGSSNQPFPTHVDPTFRTFSVDPDGPGGQPAMTISYQPGFDPDGPGTRAGPSDVFDPYVRTISNLIVDQTLSNPAAIIEALSRNGVEGDHLAIAAVVKAAYEPLIPLFKAVDDANDVAAEARAAANAAGAAEGSALDLAADAAEAALANAATALAIARAPDSATAQVVRLYEAMLQRVPDQGELAFWVNQIENLGSTIQNAAQSLLQTPEFQAATSRTLTDAEYVEFLYQTILGRPSEPAGLAHQLSWLSATGDRAGLAVAFSESAENRLVEDSPSAQVERLYEAMLQRAPDQGELAFWVNQIENLGSTIQNAAESLLQTPEFQAATGTLSDAEYVEFLYQTILDRPSEPAGLAHQLSWLSATGDRAGLAVAFSESAENRLVEDSPSAQVERLYEAMLQRAPDQGELAFWVNQIENLGSTIQNAAESLLQTPEFQAATSRTLSDAEYVEFLYQTILDRPSDPAGFAHQLLWLSVTGDRAGLAVAFAESPENDPNTGSSLDDLLGQYGIELSGANVLLPAIAPDEGLSAPFNSWFTLFGQFFDHGLDLVNKGDSGTVFIPLAPDDPLYVEGSQTNFMVLTRATVLPGEDGVLGTADDVRPVNTTTPFVDQNQTYTSHPSHQVFVRQYELDDAGRPVSTGNLIEGSNGGMATWGELKEYARALLGIRLTDQDVGKVPLIRTDPYGNFIPGDNGFPQVVFGLGADGIPNTNDDVVFEGDPEANNNTGIDITMAVRTNSAFLADIAHNAVPNGLEDGDIEIGLGNGGESTDGFYDNELLNAHFIAGDGRVNENIGLTAVHHVFHAEHNRLVEHTKAVTIADALQMLAEGATQAEAVAFLNEWLDVDVAEVPTTAGEIANLNWDGERLFQAAKFGNEMEYQHLVFEEFARKIQPNINVFLVPDGYDATINPTIMAEFAHVVYRFGHSMLTESIDRFDAGFSANHISLIQGFLNPLEFDSVDDGIAAGDIIRGMTRQQGMQIDEFVTSALRNNLLGLPLDLATINLARGRDVGAPSLNEARREFYSVTDQAAELKPYESWVDFAGNLKNEASIINFIAAYGTHALITSQSTLEGKRNAALTIVTGNSVGGLEVPLDAGDFLNATGSYAGGRLGGLEDVDLWIGGLAEKTMPFGGMLGSTFNFVFEVQMEALQNGDRFYYLQRLDGLHLFSEMEGNSFASMIMRNTDATHLPSDVFSTPAFNLEVNQGNQWNDLNGDGVMENADPTSGNLLIRLIVRDDPATAGVDTNYLRYAGADHVVVGGTEGNDRIYAGIGDDTLYGDGGNDYLDGGFGNDIINAGAGDDIIRDSGGDDNVKAGDGNDVVHAGPGLDLILAGRGNDFVVLGTDGGSEVFAGEGDDFVLGNKNAERILGNEGNDWIETGTFDGAPGDNFDEIFARDQIDGHDVFLGDGGFDEFIGEGGDDIMVGSLGRGKMAGMSGFDWVTYKDLGQGVTADLSIPIVFDEAPTLPGNAALDEFESLEGLSGTNYNDILRGSNDSTAERQSLANGGSSGFQGSILGQNGINLINGLQAVLGAGVTSFSAGDVILGGDGSDQIQGNGGDDILDGDRWLDVQIGVFAPEDVDHTGAPLQLVSSMRALSDQVFNGEINPGQLHIVRTIRDDTTDGDTDVAIFSGAFDDYDISNVDGRLVVIHARGTEIDGADTLLNIERLRFSDLEIAVVVGDGTISGQVGNDLVFAGGGDDTIDWSVGDGRDFVDGGANGALGDRFIVNGNGTVENFVVYARAEAIDAGVVVQNAATEIVITRNGINNVVAELDNIEEITINTGAGADTVTMVGDFDPTQLFFNTVTVNGGGGRDTINSSQLTSAHRLVLNDSDFDPLDFSHTQYEHKTLYHVDATDYLIS